MIHKKIAFLLDFDGPLFRNDLVRDHLKRIYNISDEQWENYYSLAKKGDDYVNYSAIFESIAKNCTISEERIWKQVDRAVREPGFISGNSRGIVEHLKQNGDVFVITQGHDTYQKIKLAAFGIDTILQPDRIDVIEGSKIEHLIEKVGDLKAKGYEHIYQFDDRIRPLLQVQNEYPDYVTAVRIKTGKYRSEPDPTDVAHRDWITAPTMDGARTILLQKNIISPEGSLLYSARMRR